MKRKILAFHQIQNKQVPVGYNIPLLSMTVKESASLGVTVAIKELLLFFRIKCSLVDLLEGKKLHPVIRIQLKISRDHISTYSDFIIIYSTISEI